MVPESVVTQLAIVGCVYSVATIVFGAFELRVAAWKRLLKFLITAALIASLAAWFGLLVANVVFFGMMTAGMSFHIWWCRKNGIELLRPEPREKYFRLRGWTRQP